MCPASVAAFTSPWLYILSLVLFFNFLLFSVNTLCANCAHCVVSCPVEFVEGLKRREKKEKKSKNRKWKRRVSSVWRIIAVADEVSSPWLIFTLWYSATEAWRNESTWSTAGDFIMLEVCICSYPREGFVINFLFLTTSFL